MLRRALTRGENGRTNGVASERTSCASLRPPLHTRVLADDRPLTRRDNDSRDDCRHGSSKLCITRTMLHMFGRRPAWADNRASSLACSRAANGVLKRIHALGRLIGDCQRVFSAAGEQRPEVLAGPPSRSCLSTVDAVKVDLLGAPAPHPAPRLDELRPWRHRPPETWAQAGVKETEVEGEARIAHSLTMRSGPDRLPFSHQPPTPSTRGEGHSMGPGLGRWRPGSRPAQGSCAWQGEPAPPRPLRLRLQRGARRPPTKSG